MKSPERAALELVKNYLLALGPVSAVAVFVQWLLLGNIVLTRIPAVAGALLAGAVGVGALGWLFEKTGWGRKSK